MLAYKSYLLAVFIILSFGVNRFFKCVESHFRSAFLQSYQASRHKDDETDSYRRDCKQYCLYGLDDCGMLSFLISCNPMWQKFITVSEEPDALRVGNRGVGNKFLQNISEFQLHDKTKIHYKMC